MYLAGDAHDTVWLFDCESDSADYTESVNGTMQAIQLGAEGGIGTFFPDLVALVSWKHFTHHTEQSVIGSGHRRTYCHNVYAMEAPGVVLRFEPVTHSHSLSYSQSLA